MQFSKAPIMKNFGELEFGQIPEPLKFQRPFRKYQFVFRVVVDSSFVSPSSLFFLVINLFIINRDDRSLKWHQSLH